MTKHELVIVKHKIQRVSIHLSNIVLNGDTLSQEAAQEALSILNETRYKLNSISVPQKLACSRS